MAIVERNIGEKSFLKYGEQIILASFQQNLYLGNRGLPFQAGFIAKCKKEETINKIYLYPNLHEIVFEIHPNLNYEALMEFTECSNNDPHKEIMEKRMVLESNLNHAKIEENRGKHVKLGSIVQLYHPNSRTYLSFSTQKVAKSDMGSIGCSTETNESVQFTITSPFDFLKEGSLISYDDKFIFNDPYNKTLAYPISQEELDNTKLKLDTKLDRGILGFFGGSKEREFKIPSIIENQKLFEGHFAGAVNEKNIGTIFSNQFEAINIESAFEKNELKENDLKWGDLINIRKVDNSGKYSLVVAEVNKSSFGSNVIYRTFNNDAASKMINLESQFEIVHLNMRTRGSTITFDKFNSVKVLLKHVLSGKFLTVDEATHKLVIGKDYEEEFEALKGNKNKYESEYQNQYNNYLRLKEAKRFEDITKKDAPNLTQADIDFFQAHGKQLIQSNKDYFEIYLMERTFILEKVSSDESIHLNNSTFLKIRTYNRKSLSVIADEEHLNKVTEIERLKEENENFENNFFEALGNSIQQETLVISESCDIFHFEKNDKNLARKFNRLNSYTAFLASVICMKEMKQSLTLQYLGVVDDITCIMQKLISKKNLMKHTAQFLMVQMSTVDLLMEYLIKVKSFVKDSDDHLRLITDACSSTINLLSLICENNSLVCNYLFQWRKFFTASIVKVENAVFKQINIDSLLFQIVDILKCYSIYIDDYLEKLCSSIKFESLDIRKLSVLLQITRNFLNLKDPASIDKVFEKIFNPAYKSDIFKRLECDEADPSNIKFMGKDEVIEIDDHFKDNEQIYRYFLQTLNLVISLGELDAAKTAKNLHDAFPKEVCMTIFTDKDCKFPGEMRAAFLKLFAILYIVNLFQNNSLITYEEHITAAKIRGDFRRSSETFKTLQTLKESEENKKFMSSLLNNLTSSNKELALASLQTFNLLLSFKFFDEEYISNIKKNLDSLIIGETNKMKVDGPIRRDQVRDSKWLSAPPKFDSLHIEDKFEETAHAVFSIDDPTTLVEVVEMLTKLHRSMVRNKVLHVIHEDKQAIQQEGSPKSSSQVNPNLSEEEKAFERAFSSEIDSINERNEEVWKVITQWIKFKNPILTSSILKYVYESSLMKPFFQEKYVEFYQVEGDEDNSIYTRIRAYLRNFSDQLRDLMSEYSTSDSLTIRSRVSSIFREYQNLFDYFFTVMHTTDRETKFELSIKDCNRQSTHDVFDINSQEVYINLLNMFLMDSRHLKSKQTIILKSGLLEIVMKTAICFNTKIFVSFSRLEQEMVEKSRFGILPEFQTKDFFKDELYSILLLIFYYSVVTNCHNIGFLMKNYRLELQDFLLTTLRFQNTVVKRLALCLLIELYKNNIEDLLKLRNDDKEFFQSILKQAQFEIDNKNYSILINFIEFFAVATQFNSAILEENAKDIFNCLFDENIQDSNTVSHLLNKDLPEDLKAYTTIHKDAKTLDISKTKSGLIFTAEQQEMDEMDERSNIFSVLELSDRMIFLSDLLGLIAEFGKNCSADFKNKMQKKLSMNSLIDIASNCKFNYYLKTTVVDVLSNIYITTKIDQNSKSFVLELISNIFSFDLREYFKNQTTSLTTKEIFFINRTPRADCLLLQNSKKAPAWNLTALQVEKVFWDYVCDYLGKMIEKFVSVCSNENNHSILESIYSIMEDLADLKDKLLQIYQTYTEENLAFPQLLNGTNKKHELSASMSRHSIKYEAIDESPFNFSSPGLSPHKKKKFASPKRSPNKSILLEVAPKTEISIGPIELFESIDEYMSHFTSRLKDIILFFEMKRQKFSSKKVKALDYFRLLAEHKENKAKKINTDPNQNLTFYKNLTESVLINAPGTKKVKETKKKNKKSKRVRILESPMNRFHAQVSLQNIAISPENASPRDKYIDKNNISPTNKIISVNDAKNEINFLKKPDQESMTVSQHELLKIRPQTKERNADSPAPSEHDAVIPKKGGKPPKEVKDKGRIHLRAHLFDEKFLLIDKQKVPIEKESAQEYLDFLRLKEFFFALVEVLESPSTTIDEACQIINYFSYCIDNGLTKKYLVEVLRNTTAVKSMVLLMTTAKKNTDYMIAVIGLLNKVIRIDSKFQRECNEIFYQDTDNKMINIYFSTLTEIYDKLYEVEETDAQMAELKKQAKEEMVNFDSFEEYSALKAHFEQDISHLSAALVKTFCELLAFPQLISLHHNQSMQNYLRIQIYKGQVRPMQINIVERIRDILKTYIKILRPKNIQILVSIFTVLATLVEGPCKENQHEIVSKKIMGVMDEAYSSLYQITDKRSDEIKNKAMLMYLRLKLGIIEGTCDTYIIKSIALSFSSEMLLSRIEQIYCNLFGLKSFSTHFTSARTIYSQREIQDEVLIQIPLFGTTRNQTLVTETSFKNLKKKDIALISSKLYSGRNYSTQVKEGLYIIIWINQLSELDPSIKKNIKTTREEMEKAMKHLRTGMKFFQEKVTSVEIINNIGSLQTLYFYTHPITRFLSSHTKSKFEFEIDRRSWNAKLLGLTNGVESLYTEMKHFEKIYRLFGIHVNLSVLQYLKKIIFGIALIDNIVITFSNQITQEKYSDPIFRPWNSQRSQESFVFVCGWFLLVGNLLSLTLWILFEYSIKKKLFSVESNKKYEAKLAELKLLKEFQPSRKRTLWLKIRTLISLYWQIFTKTNLWSTLFYIMCCILGLSVSKFYLSFLLLDIVNLSTLVNSVLRALTLNRYLLGGTALFGLILLFIYTSFLYFYSDVLPSDMGAINQPTVIFCDTFLMCYLNTIDFGLRLGGGIGDILELPYSYNTGPFVFRQFFDIVYFVNIMLLLMNIVVGIIVDSFAEIRDLRENIENDIANICFVCNLNKDEFEGASVPFDLHIRDTHYLWNYCYYIVGLKEKHRDEMNGLEIEIQNKIKESDLSWFPLHKTKLIQSSLEEHSALEKRLQNLASRINALLQDKQTQ